jgi:lipoprotein-anchoring transpeptidase ErfK/SrfK
MLDEAYASSSATPFELAPRYDVDPMVVDGWVSQLSAVLDRAAVSSRYLVSGRSLTVSPSAAGRRVDADAGAADITAAVRAAIAAGGAAQPAVQLQLVGVAPAVTEATVGRATLVVLGRFKVYSYDGGRVEKTYRCAIGMRRYPTPTGTFRIVAKKSMPAWTNPGSAWARRMPRRIKPGPNNPLGTRALYLNSGGIRIHGTSQSRSIGHAASHGCVRLARRDVEALYPRIPVGTPVFIVK